jgi:hypothetical protein
LWAKWPKAVAKITDDLDVLLAFYDFPAEHWVHLRTTNPIESTFATVRLRTRVTKGPGSRAAGVAMAFKLIESAQARWRVVNAPHLVARSAPVRGWRTANSSNDPTNQEVTLKPRDTHVLTTPQPCVLDCCYGFYNRTPPARCIGTDAHWSPTTPMPTGKQHMEKFSTICGNHAWAMRGGASWQSG